MSCCDNVSHTSFAGRQAESAVIAGQAFSVRVKTTEAQGRVMAGLRCARARAVRGSPSAEGEVLYRGLPGAEGCSPAGVRSD